MAICPRIMQHINGAYTTYFNVKRKRSGHLFQGRYHAILVDADAYALELSRYIHLNPVRAGAASGPKSMPGAATAITSATATHPGRLHTETILACLAFDGLMPRPLSGVCEDKRGIAA